MPKCDNKSKECCLNMTRLNGLVVYLFINNQKHPFYKIESQDQSVGLPYGLQSTGTTLNNNVFWPEFISQSIKYKPTTHIPNEFTFIYFISEKSQFIAMNRLSPTVGLIDKWKLNERQRPYSSSEKLVTAFWWKYDNKVYVIAKEYNIFRIYNFILHSKTETFEFQLIVSLNTNFKLFFNFD